MKRAKVSDLLFDAARQLVSGLSDQSPVSRFYAARQIHTMATSRYPADLGDLINLLDARALNRAAERDPKSQVRRVASAAVRAVADALGPVFNIPAETVQDKPGYVVEVVEAEFLRTRIEAGEVAKAVSAGQSAAMQMRYQLRN